MLNFLKNGIENCGVIYTKEECNNLLKEVFKTRNFKKIFLTKKNFLDKNKSNLKLNPSPGNNLLHKINCSFIFENKFFINKMKKVLGENYRILNHKLVMGVPESYLPKWVKELTKNRNTNNLGTYIQPKYRDITYFKGIDFHQDIIDYPTRTSDFVTVYIYLDDVDLNTSPLFVIKNSHILGATKFPHNLLINKNKETIYKNKKNILKSKILILNGKAGSVSYWHPFMLHGTQPHKNTQPRISIRILAEKNRWCPIKCDLDRVNKKITGNLSIKNPWKILQNKNKNKNRIKINKINKIK